MADQGFRDITTVVSILPYRMTIDIATVFPGRYLLEANEEGKFNFIHVTRARTDRYVGGPINNGVISLPILSEDVAEAIVKDHIKANICVVPGLAEPGIFNLPGLVNEVEIIASPKLKIARERQKQWFIKLVEQAETDWKRTGSVKAVGMLAREAAKRLHLQYDWTTEERVREQEVNKCPVCTSIIVPTAVICSVCKFVLNKQEFEKIKGQFATQ